MFEFSHVILLLRVMENLKFVFKHFQFKHHFGIHVNDLFYVKNKVTVKNNQVLAV